MSERRAGIVTGAGSGIGRATALRLARAGWRLALVGRDPSRLSETARLMGTTGADALVLPADLARLDALAAVTDQASAALGRVDALVNCAGACPSGAIASLDAATLAPVFALNAFAPALLVARLWPVFLRQGGGCVVSITSLMAGHPFSGLSAYAASKAALESLTRSIHAEGAALAIRAFSIAPGAVETAMLRGLFDKTQLPASQTLSPDRVAEEVEHCLEHRRDERAGGTIHLAQGRDL